MKTSTHKKEFKVNIVTIEEAKALSNRDYNPSIWEKTIDRYNDFKDAVFYTVPGSIYDIDLYAIYTLDSGLRFRQKVSYSSSLSSGRTFTQCSIIDDNVVELHLQDESGHPVGHRNDRMTRAILAKVCDNNEFVFYI